MGAPSNALISTSAARASLPIARMLQGKRRVTLSR